MLFSRKDFLCGASVTAFSSASFMRLLARPAQAASSNTIVVVYEMQGGNDGFNMVIPLDSTNFSNYNKLRANIAVPLSAIDSAQTYFDATPSAVGQGSNYAFNPSMTEMRSLYAAGHVGIVSGVGLLPNVPNRDGHQQGQYYWASASTVDNGTSDLGWVGLTFDSLGGSGNISPMVAVMGGLPTAMVGEKTSPLVIGGDLAGFTVNTGFAGGSSGNFALNGNDAYVTSAISSEFARSVASQTTTYVSVVQNYAKLVNPYQAGTTNPLSSQYPVTPAYAPYNLMITYPGAAKASFSGVKQQLAQVARLILGGAPTRSYYVRQGGYDTHSSEVAQQPNLLQELSESISEFYLYLKAANASSNVVLMTTSEFGRLPFSNASAGTDHGTASFHFVVGDAVKGGLYGTEAYPNLTPGLSGNYVGVDIDFRYQLSAVMQYLGVDPEVVMGTSSFTNLANAGANLNNLIA
jgi:uncharacterized protein (DUF1501 family)